VPDVEGMTTHSARSVLRERGFTNVQGQWQTWGEGQNFLPSECEVLSQTPASGTDQDLDAPVRLTYFYSRGLPDCGFPVFGR
jgi:beta-lactam-binding protein with PASTA domain